MDPIIEKQYRIDRYHKWGTTFTFEVQNVPTMAPGEVFHQELPDRNTPIVWIVEIHRDGDGENSNLTFEFGYKYPNDDIESIDFQFSARLVNLKSPWDSYDGRRDILSHEDTIMIQWPMEFILDPNNHCLSDGTVNLAVDFCIHSILYSGGLRKFCFEGKPLNWMERGLIIGLYNKVYEDVRFTMYYEIAAFHSPFFATFYGPLKLYDIHDSMDRVVPLEKCLQIMHGVRLPIQPEHTLGMLLVADQFQMRNVIRYIEMNCILEDLPIDCMIPDGAMSMLNLRRLMKSRMRSWNIQTVAELKRVLQVSDFDTELVSTGELMKSYMAIFMTLPNQ